MEITAQKEIERKLLDAMKQAEAANIYKNHFLANMSHEIRTPMNGLVGFASMLRKEGLDTKTKNEYIDIVESCSTQLLNLINDIIDVSKIEAGELAIITDACDVNQMLKELETTFNELKHQKGKTNLAIKANIPASASDVIITTDPARLKQVLSNLISNALKFTAKGQIEFTYSIHGKKLVFEVSDTGIGMSKDKLDIIFERFQQLEHADKAQYDGTGLGLAISKGIVNLLGGSMSVKSEEGKGSVFTFDIPYLKLIMQVMFTNSTEKKYWLLKIFM
jgi:two-component system CheB/CheR fusion protein